MKKYGAGSKRKEAEDKQPEEKKGKGKEIWFTMRSNKLKQMMNKDNPTRKDLCEAFHMSLHPKKFFWTNKSALTVEAHIGGRKVGAIVDMGCSGIILSKRCMARLGLEADYDVEFTLNSAEGLTTKKRLVFEKLPIGVGASVVELPVLVVDGGILIFSWE